MANIKSAIKRVQINERNRLRNKSTKSALKTLTKKYFEVVNRYTASPSPDLRQEVDQAMSTAYKKIDKAVKQGVLHSNNGARKKSQIARALKQPDASAS